MAHYMDYVRQTAATGEPTMSDLMDILTFVAVLGSALVAGIFFAFSNFVMRALGQLRDNQGIAAMNAINVTVLNPWFFSAFFGTAAVCMVIAFLALKDASGIHLACFVAASALYLFGCILVTIAFNVPLNNRLGTVEPGSPGAVVRVPLTLDFLESRQDRCVAGRGGAVGGDPVWRVTT